MKRYTLLLILLFASILTYAQKPLTNSRVSSYYTYIYKLDDEATILLISGKQDQLKQEMLTNEVAHFLTDKPENPVLPPGNYVKVTAVKNRLVYKLIQQHTANLMLITGGKDVSFVLMDADGKDITDAQVYRNKKQIAFDKKTETYHIAKSKTDSIYKVVYGGVNNFYCINPFKTVIYNDITNKPKPKVFAAIWKKIKNLFAAKKPPVQYDYYTSNPNPGFIVFNKPKYKPGDTVKFKAFILQKKSNLPIEDKQVIVRLKNGFGTGAGGKVIGYVTAYRKGGFEFQFRVDQDSLGLKLDQYHNISLEAIDPLLPINSTDRETISKRVVYQQAAFKYEEYTLKTNQFNVRIDRRETSPGLPPSLYFKATDDNGLNITDGRVSVVVRTGNITAYGDKKVFVPDTLLWKKDLPLDAIGETKLTLPDSIFPKANINCQVNATLLNSDNESDDEFESFAWTYQTNIIKTDIGTDSLKIDYLVKGKSQAVTAWLSRVNMRKDTAKAVQIKLPAQIYMGSLANAFIVKVDSISKTVNLTEGDKIAINSFRTADSLFINIANPRNLKLWYTIYSGNKATEQGSAVQLNYRKPIRHSGDISVQLNYVYNGRPVQRDEQVPLFDKYLHINVKQPFSIYPGQRAEVEIDVKDHKGKPVANADITAYGLTKKFDNLQKPYVPYFGKNFKYRKPNEQLQLKQLADTGRVKLNWQHWAKGMGLDSINYYRFTHPDSVYTIEEPSPGNITQVAPFVVENGEIIPIHMLSIDLRPVYFSQSDDLPRYSFQTYAGLHTLTMRTANKVITVNKVNIPFGKKLILSVNADNVQNPKLMFENMPDTLTKSEQRLINTYTIAIVPNFNQNLATLRQDDKIFLINQKFDYNNYYGRKNILVGPLSDRNTSIQVKDGFSRDFVSEGGFSFEFLSGLIKQKSFPLLPPYQKDLNKLKGATDYRQYPITWKETEDMWKEYLTPKTRNDYGYHGYFVNGGKLIITHGKLADGKAPNIKHILVFSNADPDFMQLFGGAYTNLGTFAEDSYRILLILKDNSYHLIENVAIKRAGTNYFDAGLITPRPADSLINNINQILTTTSLRYLDAADLQKTKELFNSKYLDKKNLVGYVSGFVHSFKTGKPLKGVLVKVQSTTLSTKTNTKGFFKIKVPAKGMLNIYQEGYSPQILNIEPGKTLDIQLGKGNSLLNDVVIRGYVKRNREQTTGSSYIITGREVQDNPVPNVEQLLQGKVAGLNIQNNTGAPGARGTVNIRGLSAISGEEERLYVVDGVKVRINGKSFLPADDMIASKSILTGAAAVALYGPEAANGAIIITTKTGEAQQNSGTLRHNFSDYAYWQPKLTTDEQGKARFKVTYPDDITAWRTFVIGITDKSQTGSVEGEIKSYKPLSANFVSPAFAVKGDSFSALGKILNYTTDTINLNRKFSYNGKLTADNNVSLTNSRIDTFKLVAAGTDSLNFEYTIKRDNGYFDGERRLIPLFEQGSLETKGSFDVLDNDTTITLQALANLKGEATVRAEASALPALLDETAHLHTYEYLCNEQLASKLKALLAEKQICGYLKVPFKWDADINDIIKRLLSTRTSQGTWGWWKDTDEELWISAHATEALLTAKERGFTVNLNYQSLINYLVARIAKKEGYDQLTMITLLKKLNPNADLKVFVTDYEKTLDPKTPLSTINKYRLMLARQSVGLPVVMDSLLKDIKRTMFGNVYWGYKSYYLFDNSIQQSLLAYRILKNEGKHPQLLLKLRNYFMEQRADGHWRNTYESAGILETILPDMLVDGGPPKPAQLVISGDKSETVNTFPYTTTLSAGAKLKVSKTGDMPVYITTFQKFWNPNPQKVSDNFIVDTKFTKGQNTVTSAKGGETIYLQTEVTVKADADFVMIEIPIPAGCSYENKQQPYYYYGGEVHREYFKNKVSIFCRKLKAGKYNYQVQLTARYGGNYHVNPAKAEMMYFPVFYGREGMKMFTVE